MVLGDKPKLDMYEKRHYIMLEKAIDRFNDLMNEGYSYYKAWKKVEREFGEEIADEAARSITR